MVIRRLQKERPKLSSLIFLTVIIVLVVWLVVKIFSKPHDEVYNNSTLPEIPKYQKGEVVFITGSLVFDNHFPLYTYVLETFDKKKFGLNSKTINLNDFSGFVEIEGGFETLIQTLPIINVSTIKIPDQDIIITNNKYFFVDSLLEFNFSEQVGFKAIRSGDKIQVYFNDLLLIDIDRFSCNKVTKNRNCENILMDLRYSTAENFSSYLGVDYYRYNTGSWIAFNKDIFEYVFTPVDDETILDIANVVTVVDLKYITTKKQEEINLYCKNTEEFLSKDLEFDISYEKPKEVLFKIKGKTDKGKNATCMMTFNLWEDWKTENVIFNIQD